MHSRGDDELLRGLRIPWQAAGGGAGVVERGDWTVSPWQQEKLAVPNRSVIIATAAEVRSFSKPAPCLPGSSQELASCISQVEEGV